jgi:hypothetical protein
MIDVGRDLLCSAAMDLEQALEFSGALAALLHSAFWHAISTN